MRVPLVPAFLALSLVLCLPFRATGAVKLSGTPRPDQVILDFLASPDGGYVVYRADQGTAGVFEIYSVPTAGGEPVRLNGNLAEGGYVTDYRLTSDGASRGLHGRPGHRRRLRVSTACPWPGARRSS